MLIIIQPFHCIFEDCMLILFTHAKCSFLIVQTMAVSNMFVLIAHWLCSVSLVSILPINTQNIMHHIVIPFKSMWCAWLRWGGGCFFERLGDGFYYGYRTFSPPYPFSKNTPLPTTKKNNPTALVVRGWGTFQGVGWYANASERTYRLTSTIAICRSLATSFVSLPLEHYSGSMP